MKGLATVFRKEIRENLRDRRTVMTSLLMGPILAPVLMLGMIWLSASAERERAEKVLEVPVVGTANAPNLVSFLEQQGMVVLPEPDDPEEDVRRQLVPVVIRIPEEFGDNWNKGAPAPVEVIADPSRRESATPMRRVRALLEGYGRQIGVLRLQLRGVSPTLASPIVLRDVDLSTPKSRALPAVMFLPYVLMITAFTGGMPIAIDTTAGEKERRSLEPLLINPVPRWQIMTGKMLATALFASLSLILSLITFKLALPRLPIDSLGIDLQLSLRTMLDVLLVIAPVAILAAALLTLIAAFAKSLREAQSYTGLMLLIPIIPSVLFMANPMKPELHLVAIPLLSQNLLISEAVRGEAVPAIWLWLSMGGTLLIGLALAAVAATLYNRPRLIFGGS